jgi:hypothetical protein
MCPDRGLNEAHSDARDLSAAAHQDIDQGSRAPMVRKTVKDWSEAIDEACTAMPVNVRVSRGATRVSKGVSRLCGS